MLYVDSQISSCSDPGAETMHSGDQESIPGAKELLLRREVLLLVFLIWHPEVGTPNTARSFGLSFYPCCFFLFHFLCALPALEDCTDQRLM